MKVPNQIAKKIEEHQELLRKAEQLKEEIRQWFYQNGNGELMETDYTIVANPEGVAMDNGEFDNADKEPRRDSLVHGKRYYPIEGSDHYVMSDYWASKGGV